MNNENIRVCLDSRLINSGDYFVPIKGENFDGHKFIHDAIKAGAVGVIEEEELYKLASEKLSRINPIVIAVTGSVGKSTMCSFISTILSEKHNVCVGKLNTKLGLATNIMNDLKDNDYFFVAEAGMDKAGEITETGKFLNPDAVIITNISESHMEKLGSLDEIKKAKSEILKTVISGGTVFLNWDCSNVRDIVSEVPNEVTLITYGFSGDAKFDKSSADLLLSVEEDGYETFDEIPFGFIGKHNYLNALGAFAVADEFGINVVNILNGMKKLKTPNGRLKLIDGISGSIIVDDTYNSSPVSLISAIEATSEYFEEKNFTGRKIAVLGGMLELGEYEDFGHRLSGDALTNSNFHIVILVGALAKKITPASKNIQIYYVETTENAVDLLKSQIHITKGDIILVKASQGFRLENVVAKIMKDPSMAKSSLVRQDVRWKS